MQAFNIVSKKQRYFFKEYQSDISSPWICSLLLCAVRRVQLEFQLSLSFTVLYALTKIGRTSLSVLLVVWYAATSKTNANDEQSEMFHMCLTFPLLSVISLIFFHQKIVMGKWLPRIGFP